MPRRRRGAYHIVLIFTSLAFVAIGVLPLIIWLLARPDAPAWMAVPAALFFYGWAWFWQIRIERVRARFFPDSILAMDPEEVGLPPAEEPRPPEPPQRSPEARYLRRLRAIAHRRPFDAA